MNNPRCFFCLRQYDENKKVDFLVSETTNNAICESCVEQCKIQARTAKAVKKQEYGYE